jgi:phage baseplate assembly protein W
MAENNTIYASDLAFKPTVSQNGDLSIVTNKEAIRQSIYNIIMTRKGSRVMNPHFGVGIHSFLFEPLTQDVAQSIGRSINSQLTVWEKRINIVSTTVNVFDSPQAGYEISIDYVILDTLSQDTFQTFIPKLI